MDATTAQVAQIVQRIAEIETLDPAEDIYLAGLESVRALEVLLELEAGFGISIPDDEFIACRSVEALTAMVRRLSGATA